MTNNHLRLVLDDPPDLDEDDDGGDGDEPMILVDVSINGVDDAMIGSRVILPGDASPETIAHHLVMTMRGAVAAFDVDVQLALERRLLHWGDQHER